jgi:energy-coupling factor transporter transmembrane protein EcfT
MARVDVPAPEARRIALAVFAIAFAVRALWALEIQRPLDAIYSDMAGYVLRADHLLAGTTPGEPRMLALWPWGTHAIIAGELALFGRKSAVGIGLCHAFVGALVAPAAAALVTRFVPRRDAALAAGLAVALWHPHVVYSGYFSSEIWFASAMMLGTLCLVRHPERPHRAFGAGLLLAVAFVVRPQILLTVVLVGAGLVVHRLRGRRLLRASRSTLVLLLVPLLVAMGTSSDRYGRLMGRPGLIAAYEPVQRLFGETDVAAITSSWTTPGGDRWTFWFNPSTKNIGGDPTPETTESFEGFIADPDILAEIRRKHLAGVGVGARVRRMAENVVLLVARNVPWPESDAKMRFRRQLQRGYGRALFFVLAFAALGLFSLRQDPLGALLVGAHLATIVIVGALYIGEARYRVPYDPLLLVVAVVGVWRLGGQIAARRAGRGRAPG